MNYTRTLRFHTLKTLAGHDSRSYGRNVSRGGRGPCTCFARNHDGATKMEPLAIPRRRYLTCKPELPETLEGNAHLHVERRVLHAASSVAGTRIRCDFQRALDGASVRRNCVPHFARAAWQVPKAR